MHFFSDTFSWIRNEGNVPPCFFLFLFAGIQVEFGTFVRVPLWNNAICTCFAFVLCSRMFPAECVSCGKYFFHRYFLPFFAWVKLRGTGHTVTGFYRKLYDKTAQNESYLHVFAFFPFFFFVLLESTSIKCPFNFCEYSLFSLFVSIYTDYAYALLVFFTISAWQKNVIFAIFPSFLA